MHAAAVLGVRDIGRSVILAAHVSVSCYCLTCSYTGSVEMLMIPAAIYLKVMPPDSPLYLQAKILFVFGGAVMIAVLSTTVMSFL